MERKDPMKNLFPDIAGSGVPGSGPNWRWYAARQKLQRERGLPELNFRTSGATPRPTLRLAAWDPARLKVRTAMIPADVVMEGWEWNRLPPMLRCQVPRCLLPPVIHQSLGPAYVSTAPLNDPLRRCSTFARSLAARLPGRT
jgi:hypothetical protein